MSQLLLIAGRIRLYSPRTPESLSFCKSCLQLRVANVHFEGEKKYSSSAGTKAAEQHRVFQRQKRKSNPNNTKQHQELTKTLAARAAQLEGAHPCQSNHQRCAEPTTLYDSKSFNDLTHKLNKQHVSARRSEYLKKFKEEQSETEFDDDSAVININISSVDKALHNLHKKRTKYKQETISASNKEILDSSEFFRSGENVQSILPVKRRLADLYIDTTSKPSLEDIKQTFASHVPKKNSSVFRTEEKVDVESVVEQDTASVSRERLPDDEWDTLMKIKKSKHVPKMTHEELDWLEHKYDPFYVEDETSLHQVEEIMLHEDLQLDSLKGFITSKAMKRLRKMQEKMKFDGESKRIEILNATRNALFNETLKAYVDACVASGITSQAFRTIQYYRQKQRNRMIEDVGIYNSLIRGLVKEKRGLEAVREVFTCLRCDGIKPSPETYLLSLASIETLNDYSRMIASFIYRDMMSQDIDLQEVFNKYVFTSYEKTNIIGVLQQLQPGYEPDSPKLDRQYSGSLVEPLNTPLPEQQKVALNPLAVEFSGQEMIGRATQQFQRELEGIISVPSVFRSASTSDKLKEAQLNEVREHLKETLRSAFIDLRNSKLEQAYKKNEWNLYPFLCLFPQEDYVEILCKQAESWFLFTSGYSPVKLDLTLRLASMIHKRYVMQQMADAGVFPKMYNVYSEYIEMLCNPAVQMTNQAEVWRKLVDKHTQGGSLEIPDPSWPRYILHALGSELFELVIKHAEINCAILNPKLPKKMVKIFYKVQRANSEMMTVELKCHPTIERLLDNQTDLLFPTSELPSLCPPTPFIHPELGGDFLNSAKLVRMCKNKQLSMLREYSKAMAPVLDSLNVMSACAWKINKPMLDVMLKVFKGGGNMAKLDIPEPPATIPEPVKPDKKLASKKELAQYYEAMCLYNKESREANSIWWTCLYKLSIAELFKDETFWFQFNLDFRGRTYPIPPHLNHQGQDYVRSLMVFAEGKPIGPNGLDWLKIHLINSAGLKKRSSNADKLKHANSILPNILDSAEHPLTGDKWWMEMESPWQVLATCMEIRAALSCADPATHVSNFPLHQDGSCNGLQHYAALGRDEIGGKSVNLYPYDTPSDVYSDVVDLIKQEIEYDIEHETEDKAVAKLCQSYLNRKVIKQSIMTTVYGVTSYGARQQIEGQLEDLDMPTDQSRICSQYLSRKMFMCFQKMFNSARSIQSWFNSCAQTISSHTKKPVEWITPLNFPCVQQYYKSIPIGGHLKGQYYMVNDGKYLVADKLRQKNGFAPNFIHSLDSTHMMLTALHCYRHGLTFMSVHDCFWTHPSDVELMNKITREQFVTLHNEPILQNLSKYFQEIYIDRDVMTPTQCSNLESTLEAVPETGDFDLNNVLKSVYFFS